ncbi:MAG: hypothetical protein K1X72_04045 [Pyrinomonadaceae bacterium]|nr:hypothetical protein [Pyrinomonadaceae bacterium]
MFRICLVSFLFLMICSFQGLAQTTVFNAPSTDVVAKRQVYLEADFTAHFDKLSNGGFQNYGYKTVYGLTRKIEIGTNFYFNRSGEPSYKEFQANAKWQVYQNEKRGFAVASGTQVYVPLRDKSGQKPVTMVYSNASKIMPKTNGLRLTGGYYTMVGAKSDFGTRHGAIVAVEQPIFSRLNFIADWYSGKNRFGNSFGGFSLSVTKKQTLFAGYNFGNFGRANNSFGFAYGVNY